MRGWRRRQEIHVIQARFFCSSSSPAIQTPPQSQSVCESGYSELRKQLEVKPRKCVELVEEWLARGNQLTLNRVSEIFEHLDQIRERRAALDWISYVRKQQKNVPFTPDLCVRILAMASFHSGAGAAIRQYESFPKEAKSSEQVIASLVSHLVKDNTLLKADKWVKKLGEIPQTIKAFNVVLSYYLAKEMHEHFLAALTRLRNSSTLQPNLETYLLMLKLNRRVGGLENLEEEAREAAGKVVIEGSKNKTFLGVVMEIYALLGDSQEFDTVWKTLKSLSFPRIPSVDNCKSALLGFELLGETERAEELARQMLRFKNSETSPYFEMIELYGKLGMVDKMNEVLRGTPEGHKFICNSLIERYLGEGESETALQLVEHIHWCNTINVASYEVVLGLLGVFAEKKDLWKASRLMQHYLEFSGRHGDVIVYNKLIRVYIACGKKPDRLLRESFQQLVPNEKTLVLLMRAECGAEEAAPQNSEQMQEEEKREQIN